MINVSVILPVYNTEKYLPECLDSIINQSLHDIEIICIDDGSTDSSLQILKKYAEKDKRIIVLEQKNSGAGIARNKGMEVAKGPLHKKKLPLISCCGNQGELMLYLCFFKRSRNHLRGFLIAAWAGAKITERSD